MQLVSNEPCDGKVSKYDAVANTTSKNQHVTCLMKVVLNAIQRYWDLQAAG